MLPKFCIAAWVFWICFCSTSAACSNTCSNIKPPPREQYFIQFFFKANWFRASHFCRYIGMHLASISSQADQDKLNDQIKNLGLQNERFWVSGYRNDGSFSWSSNGQPLGFTNWLHGQPDNASGAENCIELWGQQRWNDNQCKEQFYFVCE